MLRFGTVGTSAIMHAAQQAMAQTDGVECRAVYSRDLSRGRAFADSVGVAAVCTDYDALLAREDIDAVYIASPNRFHAEQACRAMRAGKHVIVEKPAAVTIAQVQQMISTARENGVFFFDFCLIAPITLMIIHPKDVSFGLIPSIAVAAYTTYKITIAIINYVKVKKYNNIMFKFVNELSVVDAFVSILTLQHTLIMVNGGMTTQMLKLSSATSFIILLAIIIFSIVSMKKTIKNT